MEITWLSFAVIQSDNMTVNPKFFKEQSERIYAKNNKYNNRELEYILQYLDYETSVDNPKSWTALFEEAFANKFGFFTFASASLIEAPPIV